jgi:antirestriction protein
MQVAYQMKDEIPAFPGKEFFAYACEQGIDSRLFYIFAGCEGILNPRQALDAFTARNAGTAKSLVDWAKKFARQSDMLKAIPEHLRPYFDYASWAKDAEASGEILVIELYDDEITVFWSSRGKNTAPCH